MAGHGWVLTLVSMIAYQKSEYARYEVAGEESLPAPNDSLYVVELSQRSGKPCANCVDPSCPSDGARLPFLDRLNGQAILLIKVDDVLTNPGLITARKQVWICDICHRQIQVMKQISIRCNRIEHWVHLRYTGIRLAQYTDVWTCHQHK